MRRHLPMISPQMPASSRGGGTLWSKSQKAGQKTECERQARDPFSDGNAPRLPQST
jgi:hypothetical protein